MNRSIVRTRLVLAACTALGATALVSSGCNTTPPPTAEQRATGRQPIPVDSTWRSFAEENFRGMVLAEVRAQPDLRFVTAPDISAVKRLDNGQVELTAIGEVDLNDVSGNRYRRPFYVTWLQTSHGWEPTTTALKPGKLSPTPLRGSPTTTPTVVTTRPVTPADPSAMPPATPPAAPALPPAGGGGTPALPPSGGSGSPSVPPP